MIVFILVGAMSSVWGLPGAHFQPRNEIQSAFFKSLNHEGASSLPFSIKELPRGQSIKLLQSKKGESISTFTDSKNIEGPEHSSPHQISLQFYDERWSHFCSGSLMNECTVLTTSICAFLYLFLNEYEARLVAGAFDLSVHESFRQSSYASEIIFHPEEDYDFAIIKLGNCFTTNKYVKAIEIVSKIDHPVTCTYSGWNTFDMEYDPTKRQGKLKNLTMVSISNDKCESYYGDISRTMFCAISHHPNNEVWDWGGPFVCGNKLAAIDTFPETVLEGEYLPGLFSDVSMVKSWVNSVKG